MPSAVRAGGGRTRRPLMDRREFLAAATIALHSTARAAEPARAPGGALLYNGIRLPSPWPPRVNEITRDPVTPPYLQAPPAVIPIDLGRQLLVDDFLIEETTLRRTFHRPREHAANP